MGKIVKKNLACPDKSCGSHDARQLYEDGTSFCFSCRRFFGKEYSDADVIKEAVKHMSKEQKITADDVSKLPMALGIKDRKISKEVTDFFGIRVSYDEDGDVDSHFYPYDKGRAYKQRRLPKSFSWVSKSKNLFGQHLFNGAGKRLIITEGEIDAMSVAQASLEKYGKIYPVVSLASASETKAILENRDWVRSFQEVVLFLDNDDVGEKATAEAVKIVGYDKAKLVKLPEDLKDANEVLKKHGGGRVLQFVFDAAPYVPVGIIGKEAIWEALEQYNQLPSLPYPPCMAGVNAKLKGKRLGEITLFISGTGSGKSTLLREDMIWTKAQTTPDVRLGVISLEESPPEFARKIAGMEIGRNPALEEIPLQELRPGFDSFFGDDRIMLLDHQGALVDESIVDKMEYMCLSGCQYIYIDHITILVSEGAGDLTGNEAQDKVMNRMLRLVKKYPLWLGIVSHLRKTPATVGKSFEEGRLPSLDDIKGSGSIKQISFDVISFARNMTAEIERERNTIKMRVLKSRTMGQTGSVRGARYIPETGRLIACEEDVNEEFVTL
jgi:twinkle protein